MNRLLIVILFCVILVGCDDRGAVVFAPTALPPDLSPQVYTHPSGAFSVAVPRHWSVFVQNMPMLAAASFTPPEALRPSVRVYGLRVDETALDFSSFLNTYQSALRPDLARYEEQERQAMADGSWRMTGVRATVGGLPEQVNTFVVYDAGRVGIIDVVVPEDRATLDTLEQLTNSFTLGAEASLEVADLSQLQSAVDALLEVNNVTTWGTSDGVFFVTGEVVNSGPTAVEPVPVRVQLEAADGSPLVGAEDVTMGYGIPAGGFAPFSLRFGAGQPDGAVRYSLFLGGESWLPTETQILYGAPDLNWVEEVSRTAEGHWLVDGEVTNTSSTPLVEPVAVVTMLDAQRDVIAAGWVPVIEGELAAGETSAFHLRIPEFGSIPEDTIVTIHARPAS